jgi:isocitrate dehydrogenase kinase/phosphatase
MISHSPSIIIEEPMVLCSSVAPQDVFPEQLCTFVSANPVYKKYLLSTHPELEDPAYWRQAQYNYKQGVVSHIYPYPAAQRFIHYW